MIQHNETWWTTPATSLGRRNHSSSSPSSYLLCVFSFSSTYLLLPCFPLPPSLPPLPPPPQPPPCSLHPTSPSPPPLPLPPPLFQENLSVLRANAGFQGKATIYPAAVLLSSSTPVPVALPYPVNTATKAHSNYCSSPPILGMLCVSGHYSVSI